MLGSSLGISDRLKRSAKSLLSLDFANSRYWAKGTASPFADIAGLTVNRSSVGYAEKLDGSLVQFPSNTARITDRGLLVEEARTNLLTRSQDFVSAPWVNTGGTVNVTANAALAPDGTLTATQFDVAAGDSRRDNTNVPVAASTTYTFSLYVRAITGTVTIRIGGFDGTNSLATPDTVVGTEWTRMTYTFTTAVGATTFNARIRNSQAASGNAQSFYVWGAQVELGSFATSYIPTTSASATRAIEQISLSGMTGVSAFTFIAEMITPTNVANYNHMMSWTTNPGSNGNDVNIFWNNNSPRVVASNNFSSGVQAYLQTLGTQASGSRTKVAIAGTGAQINMAHNGVKGMSAAFVTPNTLSHLNIGMAYWGGLQLNSYLQKLVMYPRAFTDAELVAASQ